MKRKEDELFYDYCARRLNDQIMTKAYLKGFAFIFKPGQSAKRQVPKLLKGKAMKKKWKKAKHKMMRARAEAMV